jgi:hypothetical protein
MVPGDTWDEAEDWTMIVAVGVFDVPVIAGPVFPAPDPVVDVAYCQY